MYSLYDKIVDLHTVKTWSDNTVLLYVDFHVLKEYTSPQAFFGLKKRGLEPFNPGAALAVVDHVSSTQSEQLIPIGDIAAGQQIHCLKENCDRDGIRHFGAGDSRRGIEHVVAPEQGFILPGMTVVCGDSHTTTYGSLGALGFGVGTSEIEHALATQTIVYRRLRNMLVRINGELAPTVTAKDLVIYLIQKIGASGGNGYAIEFAGSTIDSMSIESRMTLCNMTMESGARAVLIAPDQKTLEYISNKPFAPTGENWDRCKQFASRLESADSCVFDRVVTIDGSSIEPQVTWGTSPDQACGISRTVPDPDCEPDPVKRKAMQRALRYMGLEPGTAMTSIAVNKVFLGSCTNSRLEDLRRAARVIKGRKVSTGVQAIVVPGSEQVRMQAEEEGIAETFLSAGFEWRRSGCSMCLAMNDDVLDAGDRCASSTNRNFEGRQGRGARTHLMSPELAAAAAIAGRITRLDEPPDAAFSS